MNINLADTNSMSISEMLFSCEALKVAPSESPFLYTSGLIGPYYVNTHYLCGGANRSEEILSKITALGNNHVSISKEIPKLLLETINSYPIYKEIINRLKDISLKLIEENDIKFISGGQRRDWFFSIPLAIELSIPHIYIYNDKSMYDESGVKFNNSKLSKSLHVADLLSVGSSYVSKWIPALKSENIEIIAALNCVDRNQGGAEILLNSGIKNTRSLTSINDELFLEANKKKIITNEQLDLVLSFLNDPFSSMKSFLENNPSFVKKSLNSDAKSVERMRKTLEGDLYKLGSSFLEQFK